MLEGKWRVQEANGWMRLLRDLGQMDQLVPCVCLACLQEESRIEAPEVPFVEDRNRSCFKGSGWGRGKVDEPANLLGHLEVGKPTPCSLAEPQLSLLPTEVDPNLTLQGSLGPSTLTTQVASSARPPNSPAWEQEWRQCLMSSPSSSPTPPLGGWLLPEAPHGLPCPLSSRFLCSLAGA